MTVRMTITPPSKPPETLADVESGVACLDSNGKLVWRSGQGVMTCPHGGWPEFNTACRPGSIRVVKVLGKITFTWNTE
jgi:hypothetical protein